VATKGVAAEAIRIHAILRQFNIDLPVDVKEVALELSRARFPDDPIIDVIGDRLPGFEGALIPVEANKGWAIIYNTDIKSSGRVNFTLAHEFGHYLLHRLLQPQFQCGNRDMLTWDSEHGKIESEANRFASYLLMPIDDYKSQIVEPITMDVFKHCADRYQVSLTASILKWLEFTTKEAILVVSRDGYMLWAWSSNAAFKNYLFFRTSGAPIAVPPGSLVARGVQNSEGVNLAPDVWWPDRGVKEMTLLSENHDMTFSLLIF